MSETNKIMSSIQFPNTETPYQVQDPRIPMDPGDYQQLVTGADGKWAAERRLAYTSISYTEILPKESVTVAATEGSSALTADLTGLVPIEVGKKYRVTFDGVAYTCVAFNHASWGAICLGNGRLNGGSTKKTDEPFCINVWASTAASISLVTEGTHTVSVDEIVETHTPIQPEYLTGEKPQPYMQLVTDGEGQAKWEQRLAWKESEKVEIIWDGNTEGLTNFPSFDGKYDYWKVSSLNLSDEVINNGFVIVEGKTLSLQELLADAIINENVILTEWCAFVREENVEVDGVVIPEQGVYFAQTKTDTCTSFFNDAIIHKISPEYLPEGIGYKTNGETYLQLKDYQLNFGTNTFESDAFEWLEEGKTYNVTIVTPSGETKNFAPMCTSYNDEYLELECDYSGDGYLLNIRYFPDGNSQINDTGEGGVFSITVVGEETTHPVPAEYLPEPIVFTASDDLNTVTSSVDLATIHAMSDEEFYATEFELIAPNSADSSEAIGNFRMKAIVSYKGEVGGELAFICGFFTVVGNNMYSVVVTGNQATLQYANH